MNILKRSYYSYQSLGHVMTTTDLVELVPTLNLPVFIYQGLGLHDYQTTHQAKHFYESVKASNTKMYTFKHSSRTSFFEEPERFHHIIQEESTGEIYGKRKIDVEPVFGFLMVSLSFTRFSVRGKEKVKNEMGFAFMAVNLRKYTAMNSSGFPENQKRKDKKSVCSPKKTVSIHFFIYYG